jgi:hypothetical protein
MTDRFGLVFSSALLLLVLLAPSMAGAQPNITALNPEDTTGCFGCTLSVTITGTGFVNGAQVFQGNQQRSATVNSSTQITATLAADAAGSFAIRVRNPDNNEDTFFSFTVRAPLPAASSASSNVCTASNTVVAGRNNAITVTGSNFLLASLLRYNGDDVNPTTVTSATSLRATVPASDIGAAGGTAQVRVFNPPDGGGGGVSGTITVNIVAEGTTPTVSSFSPTSATAGQDAFTLTVSGANFANGATVRFGGIDRPTTFVNAAQLTASIPASAIASAGTATVVVGNPSTCGPVFGTAPTSFTINAPATVPNIIALAPATVAAGSGQFTLTVNGTNFTADSTVRVNGSNRVTTFVSATQLTATIPATDVAAAGAPSVTVFRATGSVTSNAVPLIVATVPTLASLNPATVAPGGAEFTLTLTGTAFVSTSVVRVNGTSRATTFVRATQLTATIPAADIAATGSLSVTVFTPGVGESEARTLTITNPPPVLTGISPTSTATGSGAFTLNVTGNSFSSNSIIQFAGTPLPTTFTSGFVMSAQVPANLVAASGTVDITVVTPPPGGGLSDPLQFQIRSSTLAAAVLPVSRSVQVGTAATAFATIINLGTTTATGCGPALDTTLQATFTFNMTDPATNLVAGDANVAASIPPQGSQSFVFAITPTSDLPVTDVRFRFVCSGIDPAPLTSGLNTLLLSASFRATPDVVALAATPSNDGVTRVPGVGGTGVFSVATVNVGGSGTVTASVDTGGATLPLEITICETNAQTGVCLSPPAATASRAMAANATGTFAVFVRATGAVAFSPAANRAVVRFRDEGNVVRGATSVAVRTE